MKVAATRNNDGSTSGDGGFTLIETIVSLALLGLMLAMIPSALRLGRQAWRAEAQLERSASIASARTVISKYLGMALPAGSAQSAGSAIDNIFEGRGEAVTFIGTAPEGLPIGGVRGFRLALEPAGAAGRPGQLNLTLRHAPFRTDLGLKAVADPTNSDVNVLVEDVARLGFRYFGPVLSSEQGDAWQDGWIGRNSLPELIEVTFVPARATNTDRPPEVQIVKLKLIARS